ncbi:MAG TPA: GNAT family N-acetyltransferase, partial [Actinomycetota bacterium]|nr:GNAT family N-acetyltransferase [Actinomycetota bacterium]
MKVRDASRPDAEAVASIYNHYIANSVITFEVDPVSDEEMALRIAEVQTSSYPWLVAELDGVVAGYAYATQWTQRFAYRFSAEVTIYLASEFGGRGIGSALYGELISQLRTKGM